MALKDFQTALGRFLCAPMQNAAEEEKSGLLRKLALSAQERASLSSILSSSGFQFTAAVQRSWCEGRAAESAPLTLSTLPLAQRRRMISEWVSIGGGASSFFDSEADSFLEFIASRLRDPSHELTIARLERAVHRANEAAATFKPPAAGLCNKPGIEFRRSDGAALVHFFAKPQRIFEALSSKGPLPPVSTRSYPVLFAPGLPARFRAATAHEATLWEKLAAPVTIRELWGDKRTRQILEDFVVIGAAVSSTDDGG